MSKPKVPFKKLDDYCRSRYGYGILEVEATVALWVAEAFGGRDNWRTISNKRNKVGKYTPHPAFGSLCF